MSKTVLILCDYDALYAAIELQLGHLLGTRLIRLASGGTDRMAERHPADEIDLLIVATVSPTVDPVAALSRVSLFDRVGKTPLLVISEQPSRSESDDKITYLNFPFDIDQLTGTVRQILDNRTITPLE